MGTYGNSVVIVLGSEHTSWISITRSTDAADVETSGCGGTHKPMRLHLPNKVRTSGEFAAIILEHVRCTTLESFRVCVCGDINMPYKVLIARAILGILRAEKMLYIAQNVAVRIALINPIPTNEDGGGYMMDMSPVSLIMMDEGKLYLKDRAEPHILYEDVQAFSTWGVRSQKMKRLIREGDDRLYYEEKIEKFIDQLVFRVLRSDTLFQGKYATLTGDTGVGGGTGGIYATPIHLGAIARHGYVYVGDAEKYLERLAKLKNVIALEQANIDRKKRGERTKFTYDTEWEARKQQSTTVQIAEELKRREDKIKEKWRRFHVMNQFLQLSRPVFAAQYLAWIGSFIVNNSRAGAKFGQVVTGAQWNRDGGNAVGNPHDISISISEDKGDDVDGKGNEMWFDKENK